MPDARSVLIDLCSPGRLPRFQTRPERLQKIRKLGQTESHEAVDPGIVPIAPKRNSPRARSDRDSATQSAPYPLIDDEKPAVAIPGTPSEIDGGILMRQLLWRLPCWFLISFVRLYQWTLSPLLGKQCRFHPSCSEYMIGSINKYGPIVGLWRGVKRICRCHPAHPGGYDPP